MNSTTEPVHSRTQILELYDFTILSLRVEEYE